MCAPKFTFATQQLQVTFVDVDLPSLDPVTSECNSDYLEVGGTRFCGTIQNRVGKWCAKEDLLKPLSHVHT